MKVALKITPQRSTQYANMAEVLAAPELLASPLGAAIASVEPARLAGQQYLLAEFGSERDEAALLSELAAILPRLGATSEGYEYFARLADVDGPLLRPIEPRFTPFVPLEMAEVRRYKGKTNELFTRLLLNVAIFAGAYREQFTGRLRILDPLAGGCTTLFVALAAGYDAFGIEQNRQDVETSEVFNGIQHFGEIEGLLNAGLPAWERLLLPGGTLALAWNATRIERASLARFIERRTSLHVRDDAPYTRLEHTVDRVIKKRDIYYYCCGYSSIKIVLANSPEL